MPRIDLLSKYKHNTRNRFISLDNLRNASKEMLYKNCVEEPIAKEYQKAIVIIVYHLYNTTRFSDTEGLSNLLTTSVNCSSDRQTKAIIDKMQIGRTHNLLPSSTHHNKK